MINYVIPVKGELKAVFPKNGSKFSLKDKKGELFLTHLLKYIKKFLKLLYFEQF